MRDQIAKPLPANRWKRWSDQELWLLKKLAGTMSVSAIAKQLDRPRGAVQVKAHSEGISLVRDGSSHHQARHSNETVEKARSLYWEGGKKPRHIAELLGVKICTVKAWIYFANRCPQTHK